jgi:hypothetical protein
MSMYYSPEIVKLLTEERLREAREARRAREGAPPRPSSRFRRLFGPAQTPAHCAC